MMVPHWKVNRMGSGTALNIEGRRKALGIETSTFRKEFRHA